MRQAAFFDLDRTLLSGASAHVVSRVLRETGVVTRNIPGESLLYQVFETFGENLPSMVVTGMYSTLVLGDLYYRAM